MYLLLQKHTIFVQYILHTIYKQEEPTFSRINKQKQTKTYHNQ